MATWEHFTEYLDGSRPLLLAERDELFAQLHAKLGDCSATLALSEDARAAVTASRLPTDRTTLLDGASVLVAMGRLEDVIAEASDTWPNYDDARSAALSAESISSDDLAAVIAARLNDHRLWNYYKRLIDALECVCEAPIVEVQARGAAADRYGFGGYSGTPKIYRTMVSRGWGTFPGVLYVLNEAQCTYDPLGGGLSGAASSITYSSLDPDEVLAEAESCTDGVASMADSSSPIVASDNRVSAGFAPRAPAGQEALLDEITVSAFLAEVVAAARGAEFNDGTSENRVSYYTKYGAPTAPSRLDVQTARIRFRFPVASHYRVSWSVIWTPRSYVGSSWVDGTPETYETAEWVWNGTAPEDYDAGDESTWAVSPWFELPEATTDGRYTVADIAAVCSAPGSVSAPAAVGGFKL